MSKFLKNFQISKFLSIFFFLFANNFTVIFAQDSQCGVADLSIEERKKLFYYNNNDKLYSLLDSIKTANKPLQSGRTEKVDENSSIIWRIPIQFWACRPAGAYSEEIAANHVQVMINDLNRNHELNNTPFRFYQLCEIKYLVTNTTINETDTKNIDRNPDALNLYMVEALNIDGQSITTGGFWNRGTGGIFICRQHAVGTPTHEVGHAFGLRHTHEGSQSGGGPFNSCSREPVSRDRRWAFINECFGGSGNPMCTSTGDDLCDTPADPNLDYDGRVDNQCKYADSIDRDLYGDSYFNPPSGASQPDPRNLMSYAQKRSCRNLFSTGQIAIMTANLSSNSIWKNPDIRFDSYEPDNTFSTVRRIAIGEVQLHTFHAQQLGKSLEYCDIDNVIFDISTRGSYTVRTFREIFKDDFPDTYITLYRKKDNGEYEKVINGENDNALANSPFSLVQLDLEVGTYIAEISNKGTAAQNAAARGWYNLVIEPCIDSQNAVIQSNSESFCAGQIYEFWINELQGANSYEWSFSYEGNTNPVFSFVFLSGQSTNRIRIRVFSPASETIIIKVTPKGVCGVGVPVSRTIFTNKPLGTITYKEYFYKSACAIYDKIDIKIDKKTGYTYQIASTSNRLRITEFGSGAESYWVLNSDHVGTYPVVISASNACGTTILDNFPVDFFDCSSNCRISAKVYPNPAVNYLQIDFDIALNSSNFDLRLFNGMGQQININFSKTEENVKENLKLKNVVIDTKNLPTGLYYLVVNGEEGNLETNAERPPNPCRLSKTILIEKDGIAK